MPRKALDRDSARDRLFCQSKKSCLQRWFCGFYLASCVDRFLCQMHRGINILHKFMNLVTIMGVEPNLLLSRLNAKKA